MRDVYHHVFTQTLPDGTVKALSNIEVTVYNIGTTTLATVYPTRTASGTGPAPESGATGTNPMVTGASGAMEFWVPFGVFDIHIRDLNATPRIAARGGTGNPPPMQFNSMPAAAGAVPSNVLAGDGNVKLASLHPEVRRQMIQTGGVMLWWRPSSIVPIPSGFEIMDGRSIASGFHDFAGVAGAINLPDVRNKFIIGADSTKADGTAGSTVAAPGIGGSGGSHTHTLSTAELASHTHSDGTLSTDTHAGHTHADGTLTAASPGTINRASGGMSANNPHDHAVGSSWMLAEVAGYGRPAGSGMAPASVDVSPTNIEHTHTTDIGSHTHDVTGATASGGSHSHDVTGATASSGSGSPHNNMPAFIGMLPLMKVKAS